MGINGRLSPPLSLPTGSGNPSFDRLRMRAGEERKNRFPPPFTGEVSHHNELWWGGGGACKTPRLIQPGARIGYSFDLMSQKKRAPEGTRYNYFDFLFLRFQAIKGGARNGHHRSRSQQATIATQNRREITADFRDTVQRACATCQKDC